MGIDMTSIVKKENMVTGKQTHVCCRDLGAARRIVCHRCGNQTYFFEIAEDVTLTTRYIQNPDGSFTPQSDESRICGEIRLYCCECHQDLSHLHRRFVEMIF